MRSPTVVPPTSSSEDSGTSSTHNRSRKEALTERLSRSRRSKFTALASKGSHESGGATANNGGSSSPYRPGNVPQRSVGANRNNVNGDNERKTPTKLSSLQITTSTETEKADKGQDDEPSKRPITPVEKRIKLGKAHARTPTGSANKQGFNDTEQEQTAVATSSDRSHRFARSQYSRMRFLNTPTTDQAAKPTAPQPAEAVATTTTSTSATKPTKQQVAEKPKVENKTFGSGNTSAGYQPKNSYRNFANVNKYKNTNTKRMSVDVPQKEEIGHVIVECTSPLSKEEVVELALSKSSSLGLSPRNDESTKEDQEDRKDDASNKSKNDTSSSPVVNRFKRQSYPTSYVPEKSKQPMQNYLQTVHLKKSNHERQKAAEAINTQVENWMTKTDPCQSPKEEEKEQPEEKESKQEDTKELTSPYMRHIMANKKAVAPSATVAKETSSPQPSYLQHLKRTQPKTATSPHKDGANEDTGKGTGYLQHLRRIQPKKSPQGSNVESKEIETADGNQPAYLRNLRRSNSKSYVMQSNEKSAQKNDAVANVEKEEENDDEKKEESEAQGHRAVIETPDKVNVAGMKNLFGSGAKFSGRESSSPVPNYSNRNSTQQTFTTSSGGIEDKAKSPQRHSPMTFGSVSKVPSYMKQTESKQQSPYGPTGYQGRKEKATASLSPKEQINSRALSPATATPNPPIETLSSTTPVEGSNAVIETPEKVSVSSMAARFAKPTSSSSAKRSPIRSGPQKRLPPRSSKMMSPLELSASRSTEQKDEIEMSSPLPPTGDNLVVEGRATIETPDKVDVAKMKGMFGSAGKVEGSRSFGRATKTTPTPASPPPSFRSAARTDVSTPHAPAIPERSVSSDPMRARQIGSRSWTNHIPPPPWARSKDEEEDTADSAKRGAPPSRLTPPPYLIPPKNEERPAEKKISPAPPKSPRSTRNSNTPQFSPPSKADKMSESIDFEIVDVSAFNESIDHSVKREETSDRSKVIAAAAPPSPRDRPWMKDLISHSPRNLQSNKSDAAANDFEITTGIPAPSPKEAKVRSPPIASSGSSRLAMLSAKLRESEPEKETAKVEKEPEKLETPSYSLTQMAADSIHAVDFDRAIKTLKAKSGSNDDDESHHSNGLAGSIPNDLPPEFAKLSVKDTKPYATRVVDKAVPSSYQKPEGIVFGDPATYGAAGGDAEVAPPKVADRARAIVNWKGGLGVRPIKSSSTEDSKDDHIIEIMETTSSDIPFGDPLSCEPDENKCKNAEEGFEIVDNSVRSSSKPEKKSNIVMKATPSQSSGESRNVSEDSRESWTPKAGKDRAVSSPLVARKLNDNGFVDDVAKTVDDFAMAQSFESFDGWQQMEDAPKPRPLPVQTSNAADPFSFDALIGMDDDHVPENKQTTESSAFDPFWDDGDVSGSFDKEAIMNFFTSPVKVQQPFSPAPTAFSVPNFEPKASENPADDAGAVFSKLASPSGSSSGFSQAWSTNRRRIRMKAEI